MGEVLLNLHNDLAFQPPRARSSPVRSASAVTLAVGGCKRELCDHVTPWTPFTPLGTALLCCSRQT